MADYIRKDELMQYLEPLTNTPGIVIKRYVESMSTVDIQNSPLNRTGTEMTIDEAIEYYINVATQRAIADEEMGVNDNSKWNETKFMTKKESKRIIADNLQLVEWLRELKDLREENKVLIQECDRLIEAKRLLKAAVEDYPDLTDMWRYADKAL